MSACSVLQWQRTNSTFKVDIERIRNTTSYCVSIRLNHHPREFNFAKKTLIVSNAALKDFEQAAEQNIDQLAPRGLLASALL